MDLSQQLAQLDPLMLLNLRKLRWGRGLRWTCRHAVMLRVHCLRSKPLRATGAEYA